MASYLRAIVFIQKARVQFPVHLSGDSDLKPLSASVRSHGHVVITFTQIHIRLNLFKNGFSSIVSIHSYFTARPQKMISSLELEFVHL